MSYSSQTIIMNDDDDGLFIFLIVQPEKQKSISEWQDLFAVM